MYESRLERVVHLVMESTYKLTFSLTTVYGRAGRLFTFWSLSDCEVLIDTQLSVGESTSPMNAKLIMLVLVISFLLYCHCYALPKLELHNRRSNWNSRFIVIDGVKRNHAAQQQQRMILFGTSLSDSNSNDDKTQDATPTVNTKESKRQSILLSASSFDGIRNSKALYVDKTQQIYDSLLETIGEKYFFFVRPRRFGKSLLCSTLSNLFQGKSQEDLFKGLWIHESKVWDFEKEEHPVLHLDMSKTADSTVEKFESNVNSMVKSLAKQHGIDLSSAGNLSLEASFSYLIQELKLKHNKRVVVIIDEYDKPVLDLIDSPKQMEAVCESVFVLWHTEATRVESPSGVHHWPLQVHHDEYVLFSE